MYKMLIRTFENVERVLEYWGDNGELVVEFINDIELVSSEICDTEFKTYEHAEKVAKNQGLKSHEYEIFYKGKGE